MRSARRRLGRQQADGHCDRAHPAGSLDSAVWDAVANIAEKLLSGRDNGDQSDSRELKPVMSAEMRKLMGSA